ncbi:N-alpha-acetyltransferase 35 [Dermatophagoides pteronyssinus]|uniref:N-alpha-acetyltransferase 35 n=1 Tax=Dermatophagoides pteronyssinus TaxID=6956 RepID=UPI003F674111
MDSFKKINEYNWIDITDDFKNATEKLKLGELVHDVMFSLYDAMAAIELMDPKMDAGMMNNNNKNQKKIYKFEDMIQENLIKIDSFTYEELIGIIDDTYCCLVTWINGHSLAQTMFINVFLHNPQLILNKTLKTFCLTILKIIDMIITFISRANVYEEEDFQPKNYGFDLANNVNISKILPMLKMIEEEIRTEIDNNKSIDNDQQRKLEALLIRIKFTKNFFLCFYSFKRYLNQQNALSINEFIQQLQENLNQSECLIDQWLATIDLGIKPAIITNAEQQQQTSAVNKPDYPTIIGFEPLINQRLLAPSFPRYTKIKSRNETVEYLRKLLQRIRKILKIYEIDKFIDILRFFNHYSQQKQTTATTTTTCIVSRSLLQLFYLPQDDFVFGEREFVNVIKESCKRFIKPPILCGKIQMESETKEIIESFFDLCSQFFKKLLQIYGHNRASQRTKLALVFKEIIYINEKCAILEQILLNRSYCDHLQIWIMFYKFYFVQQYLFSGFELELYSLNEYSYIYFELDHICDYLSLILKRAFENYMEHELFLNSTNNSTMINNNKSNNRRKNKSKINNNNQRNNMIHESFVNYYKGLNQMSAAMYRLMIAFIIDKKIKILTKSLNSEEIRYKHRFEPLLQSDGTLQSYNNYRECFDRFVESKKSTIILYQEACHLFEQARKYFESLQNDLTFNDEIQSYIKVAKTNNIVLKLFLSGHNNKGCVEFNFNETPYFPIIRFGTN